MIYLITIINFKKSLLFTEDLLQSPHPHSFKQEYISQLISSPRRYFWPLMRCCLVFPPSLQRDLSVGAWLVQRGSIKPHPIISSPPVTGRSRGSSLRAEPAGVGEAEALTSREHSALPRARI